MADRVIERFKNEKVIHEFASLGGLYIMARSFIKSYDLSKVSCK